MSALGTKMRTIADGQIGFWCPACDEAHVVNSGWTWNGNVEQPSFKPSIKVTGTERLTPEQHAAIMRGEPFKPIPTCCHSFVTDGLIKFEGDCTHVLVGQTVPIPPWPQSEGWDA